MPNAKGTTNTPIRFGPGDKVLIADIKVRHGFATTAETVRYALRMAAMIDHARTITITVDPDKPPKKSGKKT